MEGTRSMENLQRRGSLPPRLQRHASLSQRFRRHSSLRRTALTVSSNRLNKKNPYVGSFRHAPPSSKARSLSMLEEFCRSARKTSFLTTSSSLNCMKTSPYIGWFRHAPPSRFQLDHGVHQLEKELSILWDAIRPKSADANKLYISGKLRGGAPEIRPFRTRKQLDRANLYHSLHLTLQESSAGSPSATVKVLARLASWFLFPVAHDADSCGYRQCATDEMGSDEKTTTNVTQLFPHLFTPDKSFSSDSEREGYLGDDNDGESTVTSEYSNDPSEDEHHTILDVSVSSLAEAYYAYHAAKSVDDSTQHMELDEDNSRLDYVITQMDIARMARTASRHLDVASILSLPTMTYQSSSLLHEPSDEESSSSDGEEDAGWSWMIVPPAPAGNKDASDGDKQHDEVDEEHKVCVICLEHFVDGDRLRLLPCGHRFHVGCIDRWLSGTHSFEDCYTSGCPTCKKRPDILPPPTDGSVPSWAFARVGNALARDSLT